MDQKLDTVSLRLQSGISVKKDTKTKPPKIQSVAITEQYQLKLDLTNSRILLTTLA